MIPNIQDVREKIYKPLFGYVYGLCGDANLAENIVSDTFAILWEKQEEAPVDVRGWLFLTAKYELISRFRRDGRFEPIENAENISYSLELRPTEEDALENITQEEIIQKILPVLERLSPQQRRALHLQYYQDYSHREIAQDINTTEAQANTIRKRAMEKFRKHLGVSVKKVSGICSYGACKKKSTRGGLCKKHFAAYNSFHARKSQHKKQGWS